MSRGIFITGTDTDVGKTVATYVMGTLLKEQGKDVGVMKPVQCAGEDASFLANRLDLRDDFKDINPFYAPEPLSPHLAFQRAKKVISIPQILKSYKRIEKNHDLTLVEGAGGLLVPLKKNYLVADLARAMNLDVIIVARLGLGTINHTLLTIRQAQEYGLNALGIVFCETRKQKRGLPEQTNPKAIQEYGGVPILGTIPYLEKKDRLTILKKCRLDVQVLEIGAPRSTFLANSKNSRETARLQKWDKRYLWHPFTQMQDWLGERPLVIDRAQGSYLIDSDGNRYLDGVSSLWVTVHGHRHPALDRAVKDQVNKVSHSTLLGLANTPAVELAKALVEITPKGLEKIFYSDNGSTSVEIALKMAYQYWKNQGRKDKNSIVHLANSYHGDTLGSVSVGGIDLFHKVYRNLIFKTIELDFPDGYRDQNFEQSLDDLQTMFKTRHQDLAALVVEPLVQGAAGMRVWPKGVLKRMEQLCRKYDIFLIADEVATGFGRTGTMFACEQEGVVPDFLCLAKGITGGYLPLAATLTSQRVFDGFCFDYKELKTFFHGHTYTGNPLACAAALANLEIFRKDKVISKLGPKRKFLDKQLKMFYNLPFVGDVRQCGMMVGIELVNNREDKTPFPFEQKMGIRVCEAARRRGVLLRPLGNVIVLMPPLSITKEELKRLLDVTYAAINETEFIGALDLEEDLSVNYKKDLFNKKRRKS